MGYWPSLFDGELDKCYFCEFMDREGVEVHKLAKKALDRFPAILTEQAWSIKLIVWLLGTFFLRDGAGSSEQAR